MQIFPVSLSKLLDLSDQVQQFSTQVNGLRTCHGCGKKAASLNRCGKCALFFYCSQVSLPQVSQRALVYLLIELCQACQKTGWNDKDHKGSCKIVKDPDFQGLIRLKWEEFDDYVHFPLGGTS